jgi:putative salt-induced outer membrane protein YdiY
MTTRSSIPMTFLLLGLAVAFLLPFEAAAQDEEAPRWRNTAEISYLVSGGNSAASTLGVRNTLRRTANRGEFRGDFSLLRTDATRSSRFAVGTPESFEVQEDRETERTAERYSAEARYDLNLSPRTFASGSAGWQRNTFAGFRGRTVLALGGGTRWSSPDRWDLKLGAGVTYTFQTDVDPEPNGDNRFGGVRVTLDHERQLTTGTSFELKWVVDANAEDTKDVRGDLSQSVSANLTSRLALKTTLQLLADNDPPLIRIPLQEPAGTDTGETVRVPLRKLDRMLSVALVVTF